MGGGKLRPGRERPTTRGHHSLGSWRPTGCNNPIDIRELAATIRGKAVKVYGPMDHKTGDRGTLPGNGSEAPPPDSIHHFHKDLSPECPGLKEPIGGRTEEGGEAYYKVPDASKLCAG